jgi:hypothetical protein
MRITAPKNSIGAGSGELVGEAAKNVYHRLHIYFEEIQLSLSYR